MGGFDGSEAPGLSMLLVKKKKVRVVDTPESTNSVLVRAMLQKLQSSNSLTNNLKGLGVKTKSFFVAIKKTI